MGPRELILTAVNELRSLSARNSALEEEINKYKEKDHAEKIAMEMVNRGLLNVEAVKTKAEEWLESGTNLGNLEEAVKLAEKVTSPTWIGSSESAGAIGQTADERFLNKLMGN